MHAERMRQPPARVWEDRVANPNLASMTSQLFDREERVGWRVNAVHAVWS